MASAINKHLPNDKSRTLLKYRKKIFKNRQLFVFMALPLVYLIIFKYIPMVGVQIAFKKFTIAGGIWNSEWVGFYQFIKFFKSYQFERVIVNTVLLSFYTLMVGFPIPIILALLLNAMNKKMYRKFVQSVIYVPHFVSTVVIVGMIIQILNPRIGLYGIISTAITGAQSSDILAKSSAFPHVYVWTGVWQSMGWSTIIYTAALASVNQELHEAAQIDGASRFKRVIHIDFAVILPISVMMLILNSGQIMNIGFEKIYLMQNNLNLSRSEVISTYVYKIGLGQGSSDFSYATAIGLFNSVINMFVLILVNFLSKKITQTSLW